MTAGTHDKFIVYPLLPWVPTFVGMTSGSVSNEQFGSARKCWVAPKGLTQPTALRGDEHYRRGLPVRALMTTGSAPAGMGAPTRSVMARSLRTGALGEMMCTDATRWGADAGAAGGCDWRGANSASAA